MTARPSKITKQASGARKSIQTRKTTRNTRKKTNHKNKKIIVFILVSLLSVGFIGGFAVFNKLNKQFASAESNSSLNQSYSTMLFVVVDDFSKGTPTIKKLQYKVYDLESKRIYSYNVEPSYKVELQGKFGNEPVSNFLALGALNGDGTVTGGFNFVNKAVFDLFAFPVDRYVYVNDDNAWGWEGFFNDGRFLYILGTLLTDQHSNNLYTNVQLDELYKLSRFISGLPEDRIVATEMSANLNADDNFREMTISSKLAQEAKSIAVLNATPTAGVATFGARVVNNLGGRVVSVDNAENKFSENFIVADNPEDYSVLLLSRVFGISKVISKDSAKQYVTDNQLYRSDILLILGI